ncbi:MAG TPA: hypothetical protein VLG47_07510, partial [Candidatus Saccharimonadales bacterium]|nr:hypothetical protein [Candidatus Saccharimonadales bacterium]
MAEYYPSESSESGSGGSEIGPAKGAKGGSRFEMPKTTPRQEYTKPVGQEAIKLSESLNLKSLGESFKPEPESKPTLTEIEKEVKGLQAERYQEISAEEWRARAAQDAAEQLAHHHREVFEEDKEKSSEKDDDDDTPVAAKKVPEPPKVEKPKVEVQKPVIEADKPVAEQTELSPQEREASDNILEQNTPELIVGTSGTNLGGAKLPQGMFRANVGSPEVSHDQNETPHAPETSVSAAASVAAAEAASPAAEQTAETRRPTVDKQSRPEAFNMWVQNEHPELTAPEMAAASNNDEGFNDIVRNSLGGNPPGEARYYEQAPGQPPLDAGGGHNQPPNFPPTAEGGAWGDGDDLPQGMFRANVGYTP